MLEFSGLLATDTLPNQIKRKWMKEELRCSKKKNTQIERKKNRARAWGINSYGVAHLRIRFQDVVTERPVTENQNGYAVPGCSIY